MPTIMVQPKDKGGRSSRTAHLLASILPNLVGDLRVPGVVADGGEALLRRILTIAEEFDTEVDRTRANNELSQLGQHKRLVLVGREALSKLAVFERDVIAKLTARVDMTTRSLLDAVKPAPETDIASAIVGELRRAEIRSLVRGFTREERAALYHAALDQHLGEVVRALEEAPPEPVVPKMSTGQLPKWRSFMNQQNAEQQLLERAKAANPDRARELDAIVKLRDTLQAQVNMLKQRIEQEIDLQRLEQQFGRGTGQQS